jgi:hypothetical protein
MIKPAVMTAAAAARPPRRLGTLRIVFLLDLRPDP